MGFMSAESAHSLGDSVTILSTWKLKLSSEIRCIHWDHTTRRVSPFCEQHPVSFRNIWPAFKKRQVLITSFTFPPTWTRPFLQLLAEQSTQRPPQINNIIPLAVHRSLSESLSSNWHWLKKRTYRLCKSQKKWPAKTETMPTNVNPKTNNPC